VFRNRKPQQTNDEKPAYQRIQRRATGCGIPLIWILLLAAIAPWLWNVFQNGLENRVEISYYPAFRQQVEGDNVAKVTVTGSEIQGELKDPATKQPADPDGDAIEYTKFVTYLPSFGDEELFSTLRDHDVQVESVPETDFSFWAILLNVLPFLFLIGVGYFFYQQMQGQGRQIFSMGKSRAKLYNREKERTTFDDVAGVHSAKRELREIIEFLKEPETFQRLGGEIPKGVLLVGPPGTGKTLLARAVAGEANAPFFNITGSDFMEMFVGVGASRVRDCFRRPRKRLPASYLSMSWIPLVAVGALA